MATYACDCGPRDKDGFMTRKLLEHDPFCIHTADNNCTGRYLSRGIALECAKCGGSIKEVDEKVAEVLRTEERVRAEAASA